NLVRDARVRQGRQCRLLLPKCAQVQDEVRDVRLQRQGEPRRRHHVAGRVRGEGVDRRRRGKDRRPREESGGGYLGAASNVAVNTPNMNPSPFASGFPNTKYTSCNPAVGRSSTRRRTGACSAVGRIGSLSPSNAPVGESRCTSIFPPFA